MKLVVRSAEENWGDNKYGGMERFGAGGVGYSDRVDDESFKKFKSANKKVGAVILLIMGVMIGGVVLAQGATPLLAGGEVLIVFMIDL